MNIDGKCKNIKRVGWGAEDRAKEMMDMVNDAVNPPKPWVMNEVVTKSFPGATWDFIEGLLCAGLWFGGIISGGRMREMIRDRDSDKTIDPLMAQRLLEFIEANKE